MTKLNLILLLAIVASCLYLVQVSYESRTLYNRLDRARNDAGTLDADYKRLDVEREAQATHTRVQRTARDKLHMTTPTPETSMSVEDRAASGVPK
jgi:cell division protein FtsL